MVDYLFFDLKIMGYGILMMSYIFSRSSRGADGGVPSLLGPHYPHDFKRPSLRTQLCRAELLEPGGSESRTRGRLRSTQLP